MKRIVWTEPAAADVRRLDKPTAMRILLNGTRTKGNRD